MKAPGYRPAPIALADHSAGSTVNKSAAHFAHALRPISPARPPLQAS